MAKFTIQIPDDAAETLRLVAEIASRRAGRNVSPTTIAGQFVAAIVGVLGQPMARVDTSASVPRALPAHEMTDAEIIESEPDFAAIQASINRKRDALGIDRVTGRAKIIGAPPGDEARPMGGLSGLVASGGLDAGKEPEHDSRGGRS